MAHENRNKLNNQETPHLTINKEKYAQICDSKAVIALCFETGVYYKVQIKISKIGTKNPTKEDLEITKIKGRN